MDRRLGRVLLLAAGLMAGGVLAGCSADEGSGGEASGEGGEPVAIATGPEEGVVSEPSTYAARRLAEDLELYLDIGEMLEIDWVMVAATDLIEGGGGSGSNTVDDTERVSAIAYSLLATGAPDDYATALRSRGGSAEFASEALRLASRLRGAPSGFDGSVDAAEDPFTDPLDGAGTVVSSFGRRFGLLHDGLDVEAPDGTPIGAVAPGVVLSTAFSPAFGNYTCMLHRLEPEVLGRSEVTSCYGNQSRVDVEPGQEVARGETIGAVGCSGPCLRPHVHLQVKDGTGAEAESIDPLPFFGGSLEVARNRPSLEGS